MSRIQNILDKAEREGTARRTAGVASVAPAPAATVTVPVTIDIPAPPRHDTIVVPGASAAPPPAADAVAEYTVRLNPLLVAGLAPKSPAAEQYRSLRTRLSLTEGAAGL